MMKQLIIFATLLIFTASSKLKQQNELKEYICIRHVGASDKPIHPIIICKDSINISNISKDITGEINPDITYAPSINILSQSLYDKLKILILNHKKFNQSQKGYVGEFEIYVNDNKSYSYILRSKKSIDLFNLMRKKLIKEKNVDELDSELKYRLIRVKKKN